MTTPNELEEERLRIDRLKVRNEKCKEAMYLFRNLLPPGANVHLDPCEKVDNSKSFREFVKLACDFSKPKLQMKAMRSVTTWLADVYDKSLNKHIRSKLIPTYVKMLNQIDNTDIKYEAALSLAYLSRSHPERSNLIISCGAVRPLIDQLGSTDDRIALNCVRALNNLLFYGERLIDLNLMSDFVEPLIYSISPDLQDGHLNYILHVLTSISNPTTMNKLPENIIRAVMPHMLELLEHSDSKVLTLTTWIIANFGQCRVGRKDLVIASNALHKVMPLLLHEVLEVKEGALLVYTNVAMGKISEKQAVLDSGLLAYFPYMFKVLRYTSLFCLLHVTAGTALQAKAVIDAGLLPLIVEALRTGTVPMKKLAVGIISQLAGIDDCEIVFQLIDAGVLRPLCDFLESDDVNAVTDIFEALLGMLRGADYRCWEVIDLIEECGGHEQIKELEDFGNGDIQRLITTIQVIFSTRDELEEMV